LADLSEGVSRFLKYEQENGVFTRIEKLDRTTDMNFFSWWVYVINFLVSFDYPTDYVGRIINNLKIYYDGNEHELRIIEESQRTYRPEDTIRWYTRPAFLYRLLNKPLRQLDVPMIFCFGFFLKDLH